MIKLNQKTLHHQHFLLKQFLNASQNRKHCQIFNLCMSKCTHRKYYLNKLCQMFSSSISTFSRSFSRTKATELIFSFHSGKLPAQVKKHTEHIFYCFEMVKRQTTIKSLHLLHLFILIIFINN